MIICLNPNCQKPENPDGTQFCLSCGTGLVPLLRDRYRIISLLGSGGFGRTFLAEDTGMPSKRRCVIKQLKPINNNPQIYQLVQERFEREAAALEQLGENNSHIPRLYDYFINTGLFYLVQQWIDGNTLTNLVRQQGTLTEIYIRGLITKVLEILDYVHDTGIIHRDIKPDNIIVRQRDGFPVLIDFGAVKETMGTMVTSQGVPTSSIVIGTPGYMPSEQAAGRPVRSSDLFSLGLTIIYALTGKIPQELPLDQDTGDVIWYHYAQNVSPELIAILNKTIQWNPRERYSKAKDLLNALQCGVSTSPSPQAVSPSTPTTPISSPSPSAIATSITKATNHSPTQTSSADDYYQQGVTEYNAKNYQAAILSFNQAIKLNPDKADYYYNRGNTYYSLKKLQAALANFNQAIKLNPDAVSYYYRGNFYYNLKDYQAALADFNQAIKLNPDAVYYSFRGDTYYNLKDYQAALADFNQAIKLNPDAVYYNYRGNTYYNLNDDQAALADFNQAIKLNSDKAIYYYNRGNTYYNLKDYQATLSSFERARDLYRSQGDTKSYKDVVDKINQIQNKLNKKGIFGWFS